MLILASLVAILLLTALAFLLGFREQPALSAESARAEAEARLAGFRVVDLALAEEGRGAVLRGRDGSIALLLPLADGWIARRVLPSTLSCREGRVCARLREPMLPEARLRLPACPSWLEGST
jgi:hypothetical protein